MNIVETASVTCPYCGESIEIMVDLSVPAQKYTEDCQVCCQPMLVEATAGESGLLGVELSREDD
ncbi:MAG: CPXCG motif-containing cysteine-rich protein [Gammaproteobacteria bacterium]|nr:CPXCG motif-containing cysteine-rich protein [Gammaproteobacteria bacterium]